MRRSNDGDQMMAVIYKHNLRFNHWVELNTVSLLSGSLDGSTLRLRPGAPRKQYEAARAAIYEQHFTNSEPSLFVEFLQTKFMK